MWEQWQGDVSSDGDSGDGDSSDGDSNGKVMLIYSSDGDSDCIEAHTDSAQ